jgi:hypothetical protein
MNTAWWHRFSAPTGPQQITEDREHVLVAFLLPEVLARLRDLPAPA